VSVLPRPRLAAGCREAGSLHLAGALGRSQLTATLLSLPGKVTADTVPESSRGLDTAWCRAALRKG